MENLKEEKIEIVRPRQQQRLRRNRRLARLGLESAATIEVKLINDKKIVEENQYLKEKLRKSIPMHTIIYLIINSTIFSSAITLLILYYSTDCHIISPYYLICACLISMGLFLTALMSLKDWRKYLNEKYE